MQIEIFMSPKKLTYCGLVIPQVWADFASVNSLLPEDTKPLPEPMSLWEQFHKKCSGTLIFNVCLAFTL